MDDTQIYVPLEATPPRDSENGDGAAPAVLIALDRETGSTQWSYPVGSQLPPLLTHGLVLVAASNEIHGVDPRDGQRQWNFGLDAAVRAPMMSRGALVLALLEGNQLVAFDIERGAVAWRSAIGESGSVLMTADDQAVYLATENGRAIRVNLADGSKEWERPLDGVLSPPTIDRDRLYVGADPPAEERRSRGSLWALDAKSGRDKWQVQGHYLGGAVVGSASDGDTLYVLSKDNFLRSLERETGNQRWKKPVGTRPFFPPRLFEGAVAVTGLAPVLSTFVAKDGKPVSTWVAPANALLQGEPLVDLPEPFRVNIVVLLRDGRILGLRSTAMLFRSPPPVPLAALPGRPLAREDIVGDPSR
jgi:outer membrane protein assembly factor BamB